MKRVVLLAILAGALVPAGAGATIERQRSDQLAGPAAGGIEVQVPEGKVRVQCWQAGRKIIDEAGLGLLSLGVRTQSNAITVRRLDGSGSAPVSSVVTQSRTACLLTNDDPLGE